MPATMAAPMRELELRTHAECSLCHKKVGHTGMPLFWRVKIDRFGLDHGALTRNVGLTALLGGSALLAHAMGPDEEMAKPMRETVTLTVCERCAVDHRFPVAVLAETPPNEA